MLSKINYLYSGDVISSDEREYTEVKNSPLTSPIFIINSIIQIYNESLLSMFEKSNEIIIPKECIMNNENLFDLINDKIGFKPSYMFLSEKSKKILGGIKSISSVNSLPAYFYNIDRYVGLNLDVFYSPIISEEDGDSIIYVTDRAIQSLVYSIQNMDYVIEKVDDENSNWNHKILYKFYNCKYNSTKIVVRNVSKIRETKINEILSGNKSK